MRAILMAALGSLMLSTLPQASPQQDSPSQRPVPPRVRLSMLSEVDAVQAGEEFLIGLAYKLSPHWHIYWKNPGDSGFATHADLVAPPGFEVGPLLFPGPERLVLPGDLISFGYEDEVVLFWRVTAPEELDAAQSFQFEAQSDWLVCKEACERGEGGAKLTLPRAEADETPARGTDSFGRSFERLPRPLAELSGSETRWEGAADSPVLILELPAAGRIGFFPETESWLELERDTRENVDDRAILRRWYSFRPTEDHPLPRVTGLLAVERDERTAFYELDLTRPRADEKETR